MAANFAALEARLNQAVFAHISNTTATLAGVDVDGIFDNGFNEQALGLGMAASAPVFTLPSAAVPAQVIGLPLVIGAVIYKVVESMPDGTGITRLQLRT